MIIIVNVSKTVRKDIPVNHPSIQPHAESEWKLDRGSGKGLLKAKDERYKYVVAIRDGKAIGYYVKNDAIENPTTKRVVFILTPVEDSSIIESIDDRLKDVNRKYFVYKFEPKFKDI